MLPTRVLLQAARAERTPLIHFLGRRSTPATADHAPRPHPASPSGALPAGLAEAMRDGAPSIGADSFSRYRDLSQQHGPLQKAVRSGPLVSLGLGATPGARLGDVRPPTGVFFDCSELPARFHRGRLDESEMDAVDSGGATLLA